VGAGAEKHREIAVDCGKNKKNPCDGEEFLRNPAEIRRGETLLMAFTAESGFIQRVLNSQGNADLIVSSLSIQA